MSYKKKILPYGMLVFSGFITVLGLTFVTAYIREAVLARMGEPDQSLLFWYLPILFMGVIAVLTGVGLGAWGFSIVRKMRSRIPLSHDNPDAGGDGQSPA